MAPRKPDYSAKLTQAIRLKSGGRLVTLADGRDCLLRHFPRVIRHYALARAVELLMKAAETGARADRKAATEQLMTVLQDRQLC